jgi:PIN domain nuclease of toxin-antitoxin system
MGSGPQMRLLLDTHIWLWSMAEPSRIIRRVSRELEDPENEIWLSPVSTWELLVLARKRRIELDTEPVTWIRTALAEVSFKEAALTHEVAVQSVSVDLPHADPADRFIAATALVYDLTLVTGDDRLLGCRQISVLANK